MNNGNMNFTANALLGVGSSTPSTPGLNALQAYSAGQQFGRDSRLQKALADYSTNPNNQEAQSTIMELDPELGFAIQERMRARRFDNAASAYLGAPQTNALLGPSQATPGGSPAFNEAFAPYQMPEQPSMGAGGQQRPDRQAPVQEASAPAVDYSILGEASDERDRAFLEMIRIDPKRAFEIDSGMRDRALERLELQEGVFGYAVQRLGGVADQAGYQAALTDIQARVEPLGVQVTQYLPAEYPGPERLREIRLSAIDSADQVRLFLQETNMRADNVRADRNTDSLIETRDRRATEYERRGRAGEALRRRGQDMTDARARRGRGRRGGRRSRNGGGDLPTFNTRAEMEASGLPSGTQFRDGDGNTRRIP